MTILNVAIGRGSIWEAIMAISNLGSCKRNIWETTMAILNVATGRGSIWEATMASLNVATGRGSIWEARVAQITEIMRLFAGSVRVANSMQYLVLLPGLALVHRGELFTQSRTHVTCNDEARAERDPKRYLNDTKNFACRHYTIIPGPKFALAAISW